MSNAMWSAARFDGEPAPSDLQLLLQHKDELAEHDITVDDDPAWAPWNDTSYLSEKDRQDPDIMANVAAIGVVMAHIVFVAELPDSTYLGYWRGRSKRAIAASPIVVYDSEGQFSLIPGASIAEAILATAYDEDNFMELKTLLESMGIAIAASSIDDLAMPDVDDDPGALHRELYSRASQA